MNELYATLHPLERAVLPYIKESRTLSEISSRAGLQEVEAMRALQWLSHKGVVELEQTVTRKVRLGENGKAYAKEGLPERRIMDALSKGKATMDELSERTGLTKQEIGAALGVLRGKAVLVSGKDGFSLGENAKELQGKKLPEETFIERLISSDTTVSQISDEERPVFDALAKRKDIVRVDEDKDWQIKVTEKGEEFAEVDLTDTLAEHLTHEMLKDGSWQEKTFRRYDVTAPVPKVSAGKRHFANDAIAYAKRIWLDMGFEELTGPLVQTSFWVFDALFTAQDHPVREMQDTFFVDGPAKGRLPDGPVVDRVREAHEKGIGGSKGWQYTWDPEKAKTNVLRTHTTALSAKKLSELDGSKPAKFFGLGRCFRNEALDWSHLFEFNQTEGIVIDPDASFKHLLGYLKQFFSKMGFPQARFRPAYFPYTEPSVEIDVYHPIHKKWIELGGAGMFRPEVVIPLLGKDVPVLAWGPGFDRIILDYYEIRDIRELYKNDIRQLREAQAWVR